MKHTQNELPELIGILKTKKIRKVLTSDNLAHLGDFLVNFIYTSMRIGYKSKKGSIHVWDKSLRAAAESAGILSYYPNRSKTGDVANGVEALVAFAYFKEVMSLSEMIDLLALWVSGDDFISTKIEKLACASAMEQLIHAILRRFKEISYFEDLNGS